MYAWAQNLLLFINSFVSQEKKELMFQSCTKVVPGVDVGSDGPDVGIDRHRRQSLRQAGLDVDGQEGGCVIGAARRHRLGQQGVLLDEVEGGVLGGLGGRVVVGSSCILEDPLGVLVPLEDGVLALAWPGVRHLGGGQGQPVGLGGGLSLEGARLEPATIKLCLGYS